MVTHSFVLCDHLLYRLVTRYVPVSIVVMTSIVPCDLLSHVDGLLTHDSVICELRHRTIYCSISFTLVFGTIVLD